MMLNVLKNIFQVLAASIIASALVIALSGLLHFLEHPAKIGSLEWMPLMIMCAVVMGHVLAVYGLIAYAIVTTILIAFNKDTLFLFCFSGLLCSALCRPVLSYFKFYHPADWVEIIIFPVTGVMTGFVHARLRTKYKNALIKVSQNA
jgi:hypothetical protein